MRSFSLGVVHGIALRLHPSFALVVLWVLFDWSRFGGASVGALVFGLLFIAAVFGCVLLHELGHAAMALHYGIPVHDVTLSVIGGMARMGRMPASPRPEVAIAAAGPAVNLAVVALLTPLALLAGALQGFATPRDYLVGTLGASPAGFLFGLIVANLLLVVFNLLPAFPMDGGRLLRAAVASGFGRESATTVTTVVAVLLATVIGAVGAVWLGSISLPLVAAFIAGVALLERRAVRIESALHRLRVGQFALWDSGGIAPDRPLTWALRGGPRDVAVTEGGRVVGMLWRNRLLAEIAVGSGDRRIDEVMDRDVASIDASASVYDAHRMMSELDCWALPVTEDGSYRGLFTIDRLTHVYHQVAPSRLPLRPPALLDGALDGIARALAR